MFSMLENLQVHKFLVEPALHCTIVEFAGAGHGTPFVMEKNQSGKCKESFEFVVAGQCIHITSLINQKGFLL